MILEAFSEYLHEGFQQGEKPLETLHRWLSEILSDPPAVGDHVGRVIHTEIYMIRLDRNVRMFEGTSESGQVLLNSLQDYCRSYEDWQFRRWLHSVQAHDFSSTSGDRHH